MNNAVAIIVGAVVIAAGAVHYRWCGLVEPRLLTECIAVNIAKLPELVLKMKN